LGTCWESLFPTLRGCWRIAGDGRFQALTTLYSWADDAARFLPAWECILGTLRLGFGEQLKSSREHWTLRDPEWPAAA